MGSFVKSYSTVHDYDILAKLCLSFADSSRRHWPRHEGKIEFKMQLHHRNPGTEVPNFFITAFIAPWSNRPF